MTPSGESVDILNWLSSAITEDESISYAVQDVSIASETFSSPVSSVRTGDGNVENVVIEDSIETASVAPSGEGVDMLNWLSRAITENELISEDDIADFDLFDLIDIPAHENPNVNGPKDFTDVSAVKLESEGGSLEISEDIKDSPSPLFNEEMEEEPNWLSKWDSLY